MRLLFLRCLALALVVLLASGCATTFDASSPAGAVRASNRFGFDLYAELEDEHENLICSPVSASVALAMAAAGARGETLDEMTNVLHIDRERAAESHASFGSLLHELEQRDGRGGVALRVADQLWGHVGVDFESDFVALLRSRYRAPLERVDFERNAEEARGRINQWAAERTHGRIREIVSAGSVHRRTRLVITNAVYFKGAWVNQFDEAATADAPFQTPEGPLTTRMMAQHRTLRHASAAGVSLVELPYKGGLSMIVILPDAADGLDAVEHRLASNYDRWVEALSTKRVDLRLPRWKITSSFSLEKALRSMGMATAFDRRADFTGIAARKPGEPPIVIDQVLQKAFIEVDEVGTEAAAVTAIAMAIPDSARPEPERVVFHADHPFVYVIRDVATGVVLFAGRVIAPERSR